MTFAHQAWLFLKNFDPISGSRNRVLHKAQWREMIRSADHETTVFGYPLNFREALAMKEGKMKDMTGRKREQGSLTIG